MLLLHVPDQRKKKGEGGGYKSSQMHCLNWGLIMSLQILAIFYLRSNLKMHACVQALAHVKSAINDRKCSREDNNRTSVRFKMSCVD